MKRQILPILILLLVLGCEVDRQKSVPIHKNSDNSSDVTKKVPKRSEVVKEENVLDDKVLYITGNDIYLNSSFIRSIVPSEKFPKFARDENLLERQQYVDNSWLDYWAKEFYEKASEEDRLYFIENIDDFAIDINLVTEADPQNELEQGVVSSTKEFGDINSYIFNQFGLSEATVKVEVFPAKEDMTSDYMAINPYSYRKLDKKDRKIEQDEFVVHAGTLAQLFNSQCKYDDLRNLCELFGVKLDIKKLQAFNEEHGYYEGWADEEPLKKVEIPEKKEVKIYNGRGSSRQISYKDDYEWFKDNGKNGDLVSRCFGNPSGNGTYIGDRVIYGKYDHSGLFSREFYNNRGKSRESNCVLASYPKFKEAKYGGITERYDYGSCEPLMNFVNGKGISVIRSINNSGDNVWKIAKDHFYGDNGKKDDYDKWCDGVYWLYTYFFHIKFYYSSVSEYLSVTNASHLQVTTTNYCSYIGWYAYLMSKAQSDIDSDYKNSSSGYMIVPDDVANSGTDIYEEVWVSSPPKGCNYFFGGGGGSYQKRLMRKKTSNIVYHRT